MNLTAVIVDDEPLARQELQFLVEANGGVEVLAVGANGIEAVDLIERHRPDVIFLDVQMPGLDGFGVLKRLIERNTRLPQVVFATAYDRYAVRAFEVNAVDYLLKPFDGDRVRQTIGKARARLAVSAGEAALSETGASALDSELKLDAKLNALLRLVEEATHAPRPNRGKVVVRAQNRLLLVEQREICYASIDEGAILVVTASIEGQSNCRTLEELMEQLDPAVFWRVHRSYVVNIQHIREVVPWFKSSYQLRMDDARRTEIPVSRSQTKQLRELFNL
jgi:two-component system LytT family response regulator/two-component system response regulator LytT